MVSLIRIRFEVWDSPIGSLTDYKADEFDELPELFTSVIDRRVKHFEVSQSLIDHSEPSLWLRTSSLTISDRLGRSE